MHPVIIASGLALAGIALFKTLTGRGQEKIEDLQKQFNQFHDKIKLSNENTVLIEKREILKQNLESALKDNDDAPKIDQFLLQGSYATYTGINPVNGDYDIDVGVLFDCTKDDIGLMKLKDMVFDALSHPSRTPTIKNPCITTQYSKNGKPDYHVDMPIYVKRKDGNAYDLAWGKSNSSAEWLHSAPKDLVEEINNKYSDEDERAQYRRIVKYLKSWKSKKFTGFTVPSIGLCLSSLELFSPEIDYHEETPNDLSALKKTLSRIISSFSYTGSDDHGNDLYRLKTNLPVIPYNDVFEKLTTNQMTDLKDKMEKFYDDLVKAEKEERLEEACKLINKHLPAFPIPDKAEAAKVVKKSMNNTGSSS